MQFFINNTTSTINDYSVWKQKVENLTLDSTDFTAYFYCLDAVDAEYISKKDNQLLIETDFKKAMKLIGKKAY